MVVVCFFQSPLVPASKGNPLIDALGMLKHFHYLVFILVQLVVSGMMQFYFLGTGQFMQDKGISGRNVSAAMALAQAMQAAATILLLGWLLATVGYKWTLATGALCWSVLFLTYVVSQHARWIVLIQAFHGLAYVFFMIGGQIFVGAMAPPEISSSAQSLISIATIGIGLFLGTQLAGIVMERNSVGGKFQWSKIWMVPLGITFAGAVVLAVLFKVPDPAEFKKDVPSPQAQAVVVEGQIATLPS
jgi:MFS family permease